MIIHYIKLRIISRKLKVFLKKKFELSQVWFHENHMVLNPRKYHCLIINKYIANASLELGKKTLHAEAEQKLLGIIKRWNINR